MSMMMRETRPMQRITNLALNLAEQGIFPDAAIRRQHPRTAVRWYTWTISLDTKGITVLHLRFVSPVQVEQPTEVR